MIWKTLGFQLFAVVAAVGLLVFLASGPNDRAPIPPPRIESRSAPLPEQTQDTVRSTPGSAQSPSRDSGAVVQPEGSVGPLWSPGPEHDAGENAEHHWRKHGGEFSELHSKSEYTGAARNFVHHPPPSAEIKHDSRGDTLIYDPQSNTFAVEAPDGAPRTMFRPRSGRAYWDRQH